MASRPVQKKLGFKISTNVTKDYCNVVTLIMETVAYTTAKNGGTSFTVFNVSALEQICANEKSKQTTIL